MDREDWTTLLCTATGLSGLLAFTVLNRSLNSSHPDIINIIIMSMSHNRKKTLPALLNTPILCERIPTPN